MAEPICRPPSEQDYFDVIVALDKWWDYPQANTRSVQRAALVPRLFFQHFTDTSLVLFDGDRLIAFLIGFLSQSRPDEAYIHFVGVDPGYRGQGLGCGFSVSEPIANYDGRGSLHVTFAREVGRGLR